MHPWLFKNTIQYMYMNRFDGTLRWRTLSSDEVCPSLLWDTSFPKLIGSMTLQNCSLGFNNTL